VITFGAASDGYIKGQTINQLKQEQDREIAECARPGEKNTRRACNSTRHGILTVTGVDEDLACVVAGKGGGGGGGLELLTVGVVGCAEDGPGAVPDGFPF
jgi:hypothetical protein